MDEGSSDFRAIPSVDALLRTPEAERLRFELAPRFVAERARSLVAAWREGLRSGALDAESLADRVASAGAELEAAVRRALDPTLLRVVNATGVVVHTNLGRAPWPARAAARALEVATRYSNLEYDLELGSRGSREAHIHGARELFGVEAALVVNNCAAAVLLALNTLADGRETVVSRGELVEIGGSFRIPDVLAKSGSRLCEVGTTNRTRLADYEAAIGPATALLLKVHPSNFRIVGFTESVSIRALAGLGRSRGIPVLEDLGSGNAVDLAEAGVPGEPTVQESIAAGADLVAVSGDKLLGGPQAGLLLGRASLVAACRSNPLYRALRPDKVTLAGLTEVLASHRSDDPFRGIPVLALLRIPRAELERRSRALGEAIRALGYAAAIAEGASTVGGGAAPLALLPGPVVAVRHPRLGDAALEEALRRPPGTGNEAGRVPIIARIAEDGVRLDLRTVFEDEDDLVLAALRALA